MARKDSNKKMNSNKRVDDKLVEKLLIEFGIKQPNQNNNKKKGGNK